jgi:uncharacterized protein (UPF0332 family)/predicted nucleotidyltransferase
VKETETTRTSIQLFLAELRQRLQAHYGARLACLVLFGSQARGDAGPGSDIDVLVVLRGAEHPLERPPDKAFVSDLVYDLLLRYDRLVSLLPVSLDRYQHEQSPLMMNVRREGVSLTSSEVGSPPLTSTRPLRERIDEMTPSQAALIQKAAESLYWARQMFQGEQYGFAASRAYYAMFSVAQALLLSKGLSFSKHAAVIAAFGKHFAHPRIVPIELHRYLIDAQKARLIGDYDIETVLTEAEVALLITHAEAFLETAKQYYPLASGQPDQ